MNDLFLLPEGEDKWKILQEMFSIPIEKRLEWLILQMEKRKIEHLGQTDKSAPELATEFIKKGVRAKSYIAPKTVDTTMRFDLGKPEKRKNDK